jgi:mannan endo-1,4-beta-mannosidase
MDNLGHYRKDYFMTRKIYAALLAVSIVAFAAAAAEPFSISASLVTPNASPEARKIYQFMRENFQKKIISGVMSNVVMQYDGLNTPHTHQTQAEMKHVFDASGKYPALLGLDFMHSSGLNSDDMWFLAYNAAALSLAEDMYKAGGIPIFCWHWKDPLKKTEEQAFYSERTEFKLANAFTNSSYAEFNENSAEYKAIVADIDLISGYLKTLADKNVPVLWRPLHEAAGGWFWWGRDRLAAPCKALWKFMFDRMVNRHGLKNLIWVWTCEEGRHGENPLDWYPGDEYVDIIGRDYYPDMNQREKDHRSQISRFENLKNIYGGRKIIALS